MTPEVALLVRAVLLSLLILGLEQLHRYRLHNRAAPHSPVVRLPATINPVIHFSSRPVQVSVKQVPKPVSSATGEADVVRLEPQAPIRVTEKRAA